jgi:hypothetical protein
VCGSRESTIKKTDSGILRGVTISYTGVFHFMIPHTRYYVKQNTTSFFSTLEAEEAKMLVLPFRYVKDHLH